MPIKLPVIDMEHFWQKIKNSLMQIAFDFKTANIWLTSGKSKKKIFFPHVKVD